MKKLFLYLLSILSYFLSSAQLPKVLAIIAHPDDETNFAATLYKLNKEMGGTTDVVVLSNGEGGYKYSTLAEKIYGVELTDPNTGRRALPNIRKSEMLNGGKILGIQNYFFFDQLDDKYGTDPKAPLDTFWNVSWIKPRLKEILLKTKYDFIFCLLPVEETHGHHKAATIIALQTVAELDVAQRPIVLGSTLTSLDEHSFINYTQLNRFPITKVNSTAPIFSFDRLQRFGYKQALNYNIVVNWVIAEHKSQGTMQMAMNKGDIENFWFFDINDPAKLKITADFFNRLKVNPYLVKNY